jgi:hypothetical protein
MTDTERPDPFNNLHLPTSPTIADLPDENLETSDIADPGEKRMLYRWAIERLLTNPSERFIKEMREIPGTSYEDEEWERFIRAFRKSPIENGSVLKELPDLTPEDINLDAFMSILLKSLLTIDQGDILIPSVESTLPLGNPEPPFDVSDVIFG